MWEKNVSYIIYQPAFLYPFYHFNETFINSIYTTVDGFRQTFAAYLSFVLIQLIYI